MQQYPFIFSNETKYRLQRHAAFWVFWWLFFGFLYSYGPKMSLLPDLQRIPLALGDSLFYLIPHMVLTYSLMYYVIPKFIFKSRYLEAGILVLFFFLIAALLSVLIGNYVLPAERHLVFSVPYSDPLNTSFLSSLLAGLRGAITVGGLAAAIKLMKHWYIKEQRNMQLQKENAEAGLQLLKAQIHPHFLFNTLNNIYAFTQKKPAVASEMITGLSVMLRYILYEGNKPLVPLGKELQMIRDYCNLEKIRYGNRLDLHLDLPKHSDGFYIAPLLLLPLIENCFKHGTSNMLEQPWMNLKIDLKGKQMQMKLLNGKVDSGEKKSSAEGIGLKNVQKRLMLLYPDKHEFMVSGDEEVFIVNLKLELEQNDEEIRIETEEVQYA